VDRFTYDARWKYAAGGLGFDYPGFVHTLRVYRHGMRRDPDSQARLRKLVGGTD
jgi:hypothetical protein